MTASASDRPCPFAGLRVIDCSTEIAGPYATKLLVEAGACVVKVEPPAGDPLRRWRADGSSLPQGETAPLFQFLNASKRSIAIDVDTDAGRDELLALAARADLLVESYAPAHARRLGRAAFSQVFPRSSHLARKAEHDYASSCPATGLCILDDSSQ